MPTLREAAPAVRTAVAGTGAVSILAASGLNFRYRDLVSLIITTPNAVAATLTLNDGSKVVGVYDYPDAAAAPPSPLIITFDTPLQQSGNGNAAWTLTASVNASGFNVTAQYVER